MSVVLQQHRRLVGTRHQNVFLVQVVRAQLVLGVVPQPGELATRVFRLVVLLEAVIGCCDFRGNDKVMCGGIKGPKVGTKNHDAERDVLVLRMVLKHAFFERIGKIFAKTHV